MLSVDYAAQTRQLDAPAQDRLAALLALELPAHSRLVLQPWPAVERGLKAAEGIRVRSPTLQKLL